MVFSDEPTCNLDRDIPFLQMTASLAPGALTAHNIT